MGVFGLLILLAIVVAVVVGVQRGLSKRKDSDDSGADLVAYLILALAVGVAGFALAELASTAFPGDRFVFDPADELATSLAALVVSAPFVVYFWRRQAERRARFPRSAGWTLYLTLMEGVFLTAFVVAAVSFLDRLIVDQVVVGWTGVVVFGGILAFHEVAARATPPQSDAGELRRVIGSAIALVTGSIGLAGVLGSGLLRVLYESLASESIPPEWGPWVAMLVVGAPIWYVRWLSPWRSEPGVPRLTWSALVTIASLTATIGAATAIGIFIVRYVFGDPLPAGAHFDPVPVLLGVLIVGGAVWVSHRRGLGTDRSNPIRAYEYAMAALGLATAVGTATALTIIAFGQDRLVGGDASDVMSIATVLVVAAVVWLFFDNRSSHGSEEFEAVAWPRRVYHLGAGVVFALVAAGSLIATLFIVIRRLLDGDETGSLLEPAALFVFSGLATWYLLRAYAADRAIVESEVVVTPFTVTLICSHPGMIATRFPKQARLRVIYRGDDSGTVSDELAEQIVERVANRSSIVWVDEDGFRVAPARSGD